MQDQAQSIQYTWKNHRSSVIYLQCIHSCVLRLSARVCVCWGGVDTLPGSCIFLLLVVVNANWRYLKAVLEVALDM